MHKPLPCPPNSVKGGNTSTNNKPGRVQSEPNNAAGKRFLLDGWSMGGGKRQRAQAGSFVPEAPEEGAERVKHYSSMPSKDGWWSPLCLSCHVSRGMVELSITNKDSSMGLLTWWDLSPSALPMKESSPCWITSTRRPLDQGGSDGGLHKQTKI